MKKSFIPLFIILLSCQRIPGEEGRTVVFNPVPIAEVKSDDPEDENLVSDLNIFLYGWNGMLEEHRFIPRRLLGEDRRFEMNLLSGGRYTICVCANMGYELSAPPNLDSLRNTRYHMAYPDEYTMGIPMSGCLENFSPDGDGERHIPLRRMMAKISVRMDRSALDKDVRIYVRSISVGNCPSSALLFGESSVTGGDDVFASGFRKADTKAEALNRTPSGTADLYLLENLGESEQCWIEMELEYHSDLFHTSPGEYLKYRFSTGEVLRNTFRTITVRPEGDGLGGDSWRVDRSALTPLSGT